MLRRLLYFLFPLAFNGPQKGTEEKLFDTLKPVREKIGERINEAGGLQAYILSYMTWLKQSNRIKEWEEGRLEPEQPYVPALLKPAICALRSSIETGQLQFDTEEREKWLDLLRTVNSFAAGTRDGLANLEIQKLHAANPERPEADIAKKFLRERVELAEEFWTQPVNPGYAEAYGFEL